MILDRDRGESLVEQCAGLEEELREILARYHIPELDAEELLQEVTLEVLYKAASPKEFAARLGPALRGRCRSYWETRRWRFYGPLAVRSMDLGARPSAGTGTPEQGMEPSTSKAGLRPGEGRGWRRWFAALGLRKEA